MLTDGTTCVLSRDQFWNFIRIRPGAGKEWFEFTAYRGVKVAGAWPTTYYRIFIIQIPSRCDTRSLSYA
jgi:hypothetical protein